MRPTLCARLALVLLTVLSLPAVCAAPEALLYTGPGTTVDGAPAFNGTRVFISSVLQTPKGRFSELILTGNSIRLLENTSSRYLGESMDLLTGGVTLKTATGFSVHSECMTASPTEATSTHYTVQLLNRTVYVSVHEGEVKVQSKKAVSLVAGKTAAIFCAAPKQDIILVSRDLPAKVLMGAAVAGTPAALIPQSGSKADMSSEAPAQP